LKRVDASTRTFLEAQQSKKDYFARRSRTIEFKKEEAARLKAAKARAEQAKQRSKEQKHVPYKKLSQKVIKPKQGRRRATLAELKARFDAGDTAVKQCGRPGCKKYYLTSHKCHN
jgi:hypothetical protein